jgi:hypothetical protein
MYISWKLHSGIAEIPFRTINENQFNVQIGFACDNMSALKWWVTCMRCASHVGGMSSAVAPSRPHRSYGALNSRDNRGATAIAPSFFFLYMF